MGWSLGDASARPKRLPKTGTNTGRFATPEGPSQPCHTLALVSGKTHLLLLSMLDSDNEAHGTMEADDRPDYMNERVFQRNRLPPRAYFLPAEHLSLSGKWRFHYASSPLEPEPELLDAAAWDLVDVPGKLVSRLFESSFVGHLCRKEATGH